MTKIVVISDTHNQHDKVILPEGDIIVHAGDLTSRGYMTEVVSFMNWFEDLPYKHKIFIAGNHDFIFEEDPHWVLEEIRNRYFIYLEDETCLVEGINFYGSPWQPWFGNWAFNLDRGPRIAEKWSMIPLETDFLITHGPPAGILDKIPEGEAAGCYNLLQRINVVQPQFHAFGHIHEGYGIHTTDKTTFINASICTRNYDPFNQPIVVEV